MMADGDQDRFDDPFINALVDVDILKVEAVGKVIGRAIGAAYRGMVDAGIDESVANTIISSAISEAFAAIARISRDMDKGKGAS